MARASIQHSYHAPKSKVFAVFADIGNVHEISPGIVASKRLNKKAGKGGVRECDFGKGAGIHEQVTAFAKDRQIQFTGIKFWGAPMKKMVATFNFQDNAGGTDVTVDFEYDMKLGFLLNPLARGPYKKAMKQMLMGAEAKL